MAYSPLQISSALLKSEKTIYKIGQIAYDNMFSEDDETLDYERDIIFIYKESVNYAKNVYIGEQKLDKLVEKLSAKIYAYDYGELNPVYSDAVITASAIVGTAYLNDLSDVTISNLLDNQILRYNAATGQWINVGPGNTVRNSQSFVATAGQSSFTTAYPFDIQLLDVYINGVKINSSSYTTFGEYTINLVDACVAGDIVDVVIFDPETSILPPVNNLNDLNDVNIGPLVNKQGLYYNSVSGLWENGLVFVPYTGALGNVDLGEYEIRAGQFTLDTSPTGVASVGTTRWNDTIGSSETTLKGGSVILKNGVDLVARVVNKVSPNTTLTKAAYQAVRISGAQGQRLAVALAQANNDNNSADTIGLVTETIATNQEGFIMTVGSLEAINTTGSLQGETWADGDVIYLSPTTAGALTNIKPIAPQHIIVIGYVEYAHANNGKLYVKVMNGWELGELHDVDTTGASAGQVLKYNGTIWTPSGDVGITSLNGLNATSQTFATGTSGTDFNISSATSTHTFNLPTASGTNRGLLSSADWTTFNSKQNALTNPITGTGAAGQVSYWSGASTQAGENNLFWDAANNRLGVVTSTPRGSLDVIGNFYLGNNTILSDAGSSTLINQTAFYPIVFRTNNAERVRIFESGNFGINTGAADSGQRLQVTGDTLLKGSGATSATVGLTVENSDGTDILRVRNDQRILIGQASVTAAPTIYAFSGITGDRSLRIGIQSAGSLTPIPAFNINQESDYTYTTGTGEFTTITASFLPTSGTGTLASLVLRNTINQTGGANGVTRGLYVNPTLTAAADWRSIETSNNTGWAVYTAGTASSFFGGNVTIKGSGNTSGTVGLTIQNSDATNMWRFRNDGSVRLGELSTAALIFPFATGYNTPDAINGRNIQFLSSITSQSAFLGAFYFAGINYAQTSGAQIFTNITNGFAPTSGTATFALLNVGGTINQAGGANGITRGLYVNPTLTAAADWRSIEWSNNSGWGIYGTGTATNYWAGKTIIGGNPSATIGSASFTVNNNITGASSQFGIWQNGTVQSDVTNTVWAVLNRLNTQVAAFTLTNYNHFTALQNVIGAGSAVTNQYGFNADSTLIGATNNYGFFGNIASGTNRWNLYMNGTANNYMAGRLGIGNTDLSTQNLYVRQNITGGVNAFNIYGRSVIQSDVTNTAMMYYSFASTAAASFTLTNLHHFSAFQSGLGAGSAITNQYGFYAHNALVGATNNYGFFGDIAAATGRWNFYANGSAPNYLNGELLLGSTSNTGEKLQVTGTAKITDSATFSKAYSNTSDLGIIVTAGIPGINLRSTSQGRTTLIQNYHQNATMSILGGTGTNNPTTTIATFNGSDGSVSLGGYTLSTGELLQVNGTAKITGATSIGGNLSVIKNSGSPSIINVTDGTNTTTTEAYFQATAGTTQGFVLSWGQTKSTYKILGAGDVSLYKSNTAGDVAIFNDGTSGNIKFAAGGSSTVHMTIKSNGRINMSSLPTSATGLSAGDLWNDGGTLKIV